MGIVLVDMHYRDKRVLEHLQQQAAETGSLQIAADDIAVKFGCHANTARAILTRLQQAGHINVERNSYRGGKVYGVSRAKTA